MWNSNSLVAWLLATSGHDVTSLAPPGGGRAPGWPAGLELARRTGQVGCSTARELLDTVDQPRAGTGPRRRRRRRRAPDASARQQRRASAVSLSLRARAVVAARRHDDHVRAGSRDVVPGDAHRLLARGAEHVRAAGELDHLGDPVAGGVRRVGPLEHRDPRPRPARDAAPDGVQPRAQRVDERRAAASVVAGGLAEQQHRVEHLLEGVRVDGQHLGAAPEVGERVVDRGDVDRADRAEVLGDHQRGVEASAARRRRGGRGPRPSRHRARRRTRRSRRASGPPASPTSRRSCGCAPRPGCRTRRSRRRRRRPAPSANRISVVEGSSETIRTPPNLEAVPKVSRWTTRR